MQTCSRQQVLRCDLKEVDEKRLCHYEIKKMAYHLTGLISSVIFLLTLSGLWSQLQLVWRRKREFRRGALEAERPTAVLSLNQLVSSFLAFFSFFLYGVCLQPFNHYLVWPRLAASLLTLGVLYEMMLDRRALASALSFIGSAILMVGAPLMLISNPQFAAWGRKVSQGLILAITILLAQGYSHQIILIRSSGHTGAVSLRMHQFFLLKDLSTIAFALTMGLGGGWPILLLSSVSALTKLATMWHFRWARLNPVAQQRRAGLLQKSLRTQAAAEEISALPPPTI